MTFPLQLDWRRGPDMPFAMDDYIQSVEVEGTVYVGGGLADKTNNMYIVMAYDTQPASGTHYLHTVLRSLL